MFCALVRWWLEEYMDGTLRGKRLKWVQHHLDRCPACAKELRWRKSLRSALQTTTAPPSQEMWLDFQKRLAQRRTPAYASRPVWWQWGAAAAACAVLVGVLYWTARPVTEPAASLPETAIARDNVAERDVTRPAQPSAKPSPAQSASSVIKRWGASAQKKHSSRPRLALRRSSRPIAVASLPQSEPKVPASMAYAEVRNADGDLVSRVMLHTTYDQNGQPKTVQIEFDSAAVVEVDPNEQSMDTLDNHSGATSPSADGSMPPATDACLGVSD